MKFKKNILSFLLLSFLLTMPLSVYAGITSDIESITSDITGKEIKNTRKYFSDGKNIRYEEETKEGKVIEILNYDTKKKYIVYEALRMYIPQDILKEEDIIKEILKKDDDEKDKKAKDKKKDADDKKPKARTIEKKKIEEKDYEGYKCAIYEIKITMARKVNQSTVWVAKELNDLILKSENISDLGIKTTIEHKNIKKVDVDQSLFLPPKDYRAMSPF
ncbi:MAG: hypothetical protein HZA06_06145 [Nitrospirae bacterium]|nr:hypothetical protein [Nitrospirota bacterium]